MSIITSNFTKGMGKNIVYYYCSMTHKSYVKVNFSLWLTKYHAVKSYPLLN